MLRDRARALTDNGAWSWFMDERAIVDLHCARSDGAELRTNGVKAYDGASVKDTLLMDGDAHESRFGEIDASRIPSAHGCWTA